MSRKVLDVIIIYQISELSLGDSAEHAVRSTAILGNGVPFNLVGLGCAGGLRKEHVLSALRLGYRLLDTAQAHRWGYDEEEVGQAIVESGIPRAEIFIQTKIAPENLGYKRTLSSFNSSLQRLRTNYVDSLLIHKPDCWEKVCRHLPTDSWKKSWKALEDIYETGQARAIGICDVENDAILTSLLKQRYKAHVIQNWMDPFHQDRHMRKRIKQENIQYQAYSTFGPQRGLPNPVLSNPTLQAIAYAHNRSVAQIILNWAVSMGAAVIPSSRNAHRQLLNLNSLEFRLSASDLSAIAALDGALPDDEEDDEDIEDERDNDDNGALGQSVKSGEQHEIVYQTEHVQEL